MVQQHLYALVPSGSVWDWVGAQAASAQATARGVAIAVALVFMVVTAVRTKLALGAVIIAGLVAGLFVWLIAGGISYLSDLSKGTVEGAPAPVVRVVDTVGYPGV